MSVDRQGTEGVLLPLRVSFGGGKTAETLFGWYEESPMNYRFAYNKPEAIIVL